MAVHMLKMGGCPIDEFLMRADAAPALDTAHFVSSIGADRILDAARTMRSAPTTDIYI
jgi:hypothetical protein